MPGRTQHRPAQGAESGHEQFIRLASEAIWRFELDTPIPVDAPEAEQIAMMFDRAYLAECNDALARMHGYERAEELAGARLATLLDRGDPANTECLRQFIRSRYRLVDAETSDVDRRGSRRFFLNNLMGIVEGGLLLRAWGTRREVTAQRVAQQALARERELLQSIIDRIPVMITLDGPDGTVLRVNPEFVRCTGWTTADAPGGSLESILHPDPESGRKARDLAEQPGDRWLDVRMCTRQGRVLETSWASIRLSDGTRVGIGIDITERTRAEQAGREYAAQLGAKSAELARSNRDLEDFAHIVAHDLKEPLRGIRNVAAFLVEDYAAALGAAGLEKLGTLDRLAKRMHELLEALLSYALAGRSDLNAAPTDLNQVVAEAVVTLREMLKREPGTVEIAGRLPTVIADRILMGQVFVNLISNGLKYNHSPQKRIEIGAAETEEGPAVYVKDNGIGIAEQYQGIIFGIFKRLHTRDLYGGGAGAGLAIVKKIIERHGGRIWVESKTAEGSTFWFTLGGPARAR